MQWFIFLTVYFPQVNYVASLAMSWLLLCSSSSTVVVPRTAVVSPGSRIRGYFWQLSWNVPACCCTQTPQWKVIAHCFFYFLFLNNNLLFVPVTANKGLRSKCVRLERLFLWVCIWVSVKDCVRSHCLVGDVCLCAYICTKWASGYTCGSACVCFSQPRLH